MLITGLLPFDSGKTTLAKGLIAELRNRGLGILYFKPVGGHSGWFQLDTLAHSLELGFLIGHDAYEVGVEAGLLDYMDILSPIDFITFPVDPLKPGLSTRKYVEYMDNTLRITVLLRLTRAWREEGRIRRAHTYIFCRDTYELLNDYLRKAVDELITVFRGRGSILVEAETGLISRILDNEAIYSMIDEYPELMGERDVLIIEGYNDVTSPTKGSLNVDHVLVAAPGKALLYTGERYRDAVKVSAYMGKPWSISVSRILPLLGEPVYSWNIPFVNSSEFQSVMGEITDRFLGLA